MSSNWIWSVTQENWPVVKSKRIWAVASKGKGSRVAKGDRIAFFVKGTGHFRGAYEVSSDWHGPTVNWPDDSVIKKAVSEIDLKEIQTGHANLTRLLRDLEFIERKKQPGVYLRGTTQGPANFGKPISDHDYSMILQEMRQAQKSNPKVEPANDVDVEEFFPITDWSFINERIHDLPSPNLRTVEHVVSEVKNGRFAIPIFQREYTWSRRQVEELWESIFQGFFIGSILTWNSAESFDVIPVKGAPALDNPTDIILDGQQRITSLYYPVAAPDEALTDVKAVRFFVDLRHLLDPSASASDIVISYPAEQARRLGYLKKETQFIKKLFPLSEFNQHGYGIWLNEFKNHLKENEEYSEEKSNEYYQKILNILNHVWFQFKIPVVQLPRSMSLDSVAEIFEKINSKGTRLGVFDLLNARFTKYKVKLRELLDDARSEIDNIALMDANIGKDTEKFLLQGICLYKKGYSRRRELLALDSSYTELERFQRESFDKDWENICKFTSKAIDKLTSQRESGFGAVKFNIIPYTVTIPILAALMYKISGRNDEPRCMSKIETWYWATVFSDDYSGSTDSKIEKDFREIQRWFEDESAIPETVLTQRSRFDEMTFHSTRSNNSVYRAIMCMISKDGALDFITNEPPEYGTLDDHHIFPKSRKEEYGESTSINSILNRTLIASDTNRRFIRNRNPSDYLRDIMKTQGIDESALKKRLKTHLISSDAFDCLLRDDFDGFVNARKNSIKDACRKMLFPNPYQEYDITQLLHTNEDSQLEYKSSLRWDMKKNRKNPLLEEVVAKELCAFMNSGGGSMLIGVDDKGNPIGLESDYATLKDGSSDEFGQHMTHLVIKYLGKVNNSYVDLSFHVVDGKEICLCRIKGALHPVYLTANNEKRFYVRQNNTTQPLDIEEAHRYIGERWI